MQTSSTYRPNIDRYLIQYDSDAHVEFRKACAPADVIFKSHVVQDYIKSDSKLLFARLSVGHDLLQQFAGNTEGKVELSLLDLQAACDWAMFAAEYPHPTEKTRASLPKVVLLLAKVTMYPVPPMSLPPAQEVFERGQLSAEEQEGFEKIRGWVGSGPPQLPLLQLYRIWFALSQVQPTNDQLRSLLKVLALITEMFRASMAAQASIEVMKNTSKNKGTRS